jgi:hypothetical protein
MITNLKLKRGIAQKAITLIAMLMAMTALSTRLMANVDTVGTCGGVSVSIPFTDVQNSSVFFCSIAEAYFSGLTNGTTASTYSPSDPVTREQMAAFITRTLDQSLKRGSKRAALGQWWTQQFIAPSALTQINIPDDVKSDGTYIWVANDGGAVSRVRASDGQLVDSWSVPDPPARLVIANGRIYVLCNGSTGNLYAIDPDQPPGSAQFLTTTGNGAYGIAFDGEHILTANFTSITNYHTPSGTKITYTNGLSHPSGVLFDGNNFWVTDIGDNKLKKVHVSGQILQVVSVGGAPFCPTYDGTNIWVPNRSDDSITVVRAATGQVIATLTNNGLSAPQAAAFDGERVLVANGGDSVSLWNATDLKPLGSFSTGASSNPVAACSNGINFWIALKDSDRLARY